MLIGGFQHIDLDKAAKFGAKDFLQLRCDPNGYYTRQVFTNNGRTATVYLFEHCVRFSEDDVLLLPDYLCLSIIVAVRALNIKYRFYRINRDLSIDLDDLKSKLDGQVKCLYIIDYFGTAYTQGTVDELLRIKNERNITVVEDITQAFLTSGKQIGFGDYLICSTRKWLPMTDGGLVAAHDNAPFVNVPLKSGYNEAAYTQLLISLQRDYYNRHPEKDCTDYVTLEHEANKTRYNDLSVREMTAFSRNIMFASDIESICRARRDNYANLYDRLSGKVNILSKPIDDAGDIVPFGLVVLAEKRDLFYKHLLQKRIIGEIQWILPVEYYTPGEDARYLSNHNVMLQCDHRYNQKDMEYVASSILSFFDK